MKKNILPIAFSHKNEYITSSAVPVNNFMNNSEVCSLKIF